MKTILHKAEDRGKGEYGWLTTRYSFSFADWYDSGRMGFGMLRVLNDDIILGGEGFPMHGHRDMEIVTVVVHGAVRHEDSMGNQGVVEKGEVQAMSAGAGVYHAEFNNSDTEPLELFQLWIEPRTRGGIPRYEQKSYTYSMDHNVWNELVGKNSLSINQDAYISIGNITSGATLDYTLHDSTHGVYLFVIEGEIRVGDSVLSKRDALGVMDTKSVTTEGLHDAKVLLIEVPLA